MNKNRPLFYSGIIFALILTSPFLSIIIAPTSIETIHTIHTTHKIHTIHNIHTRETQDTFNSFKRKDIDKDPRSSSSLNLSLGAKVGDILTYNVTFGQKFELFRYNLTAVNQNSTHLFLSYDYFNVTDVTQLNSTFCNHSEAILSGNLAEDFFSNFTLVSLLLPLETNFSAQKAEFDPLLDEVNQDDKFKANLTVNSNGLSLRIDFYYRILIYFLVMSLEAYYSTNRILLLYRVWMRNPTSSEQGNMSVQILPKYSTPNSVNENPFNPYAPITPDDNNSSNTNANDTFSPPPFTPSAHKVIFDWKAGVMLGGGIIGLLAVGFGIRYSVQKWKFFKNRRKIQPK
ncbi:MAG: hypothetical protein K9W44_04035 [Candidatus Lokiarchaeota archaeon]|nr:hypothetical protein [Candidatus Harpocratesius repetitus]